MRRRHLMQGCCAALGAGLFTGLGLQPAQAADTPWLNPCRGPLPPALAQHPVVRAAFSGLDSSRLVDTHAHLLGNGDSGSGCTLHPSLNQWWHPTEVLRKRGILNAACVGRDAPSIDRAYVQRLLELADGFPAGARWWLFAFDQAMSDDGQPAPEWTTFHVPDTYTARIAQTRPDRFDWVASIHPYREDALPRLEAALAAGAVAVKWLPSAMNIDLRDPRSRRFAERLGRSGRPLIVHCGEEKAVPGAGRDELGNPLHVRALLEQGARVVVAHCATLGEAIDEDLPSRPVVPAFSLFVKLMGERTHERLLLGDLSAVFQRNREPWVWQALLQRQDWHPRLLHGSDHPLPGVMPLVSWRKLIDAQVLDPAHAEPLQRVREHNPLLADFALKRQLRYGGQRLPASVFEGSALVRA